jgi:hypothetical protein
MPCNSNDPCILPAEAVSNCRRMWVNEGFASGPPICLFHQFLEPSNFKDFANAVKNTRVLTFLEVGLNAFLGITTKMMDQFPHGFLWGLPIAMFDIALLWQPAEDMARRLSKRPDAPQLPSWSWVGWQGHVNELYWSEEYETGTSPTGSDTSTPTANSRLITKITPVCKFDYIQDGTTISVKPEYPLPIGDHITPLIKQPSPVLFVHGPVAKCKMRMHSSYPDRRRHPGNTGLYRWLSVLNLTDDAPVPCGIMFMSASLYSTMHECECELLALLSGVSPVDPVRARVLDDYPCPPHLQERKLYGSYKVLWITRKDGVAYRRALGKYRSRLGSRLLQGSINSS